MHAPALPDSVNAALERRPPSRMLRNLHQIAETYLAVAILIEQAAQQTTTQTALLLGLRMLAAQHLGPGRQVACRLRSRAAQERT